jgi:hypothetical protein
MVDPIPFSKPATTRHGSDVSAEELLAFERLLVELSSKFANLAGEECNSDGPVADSGISRLRSKPLR